MSFYVETLLYDSSLSLSLSLSKLSILLTKFKIIFHVQRMGNIDDAVPFFGKGFNKIYPLIMVVYTLLIASNFFNRVIEYCGNWKIFKFQNESDDTDGFDPSGVIILQKGEQTTTYCFLCMCDPILGYKTVNSAIKL